MVVCRVHIFMPRQIFYPKSNDRFGFIVWTVSVYYNNCRLAVFRLMSASGT